jgi:5'-methylthioadenosine phosphorylase
MEGLFKARRERRVRTKYGVVTVYLCSTGRTGFYFLPRHGRGHEVPPHRINFRANLLALDALGVQTVIATGAVGSVSKKLRVGEVGLVDQFIDMSKRHLTLFEARPVHTDMTRPYDSGLQEKLSRAASEEKIGLGRGLTYVSVDGPRYETAAEVRMFATLGGDVVGMTGAPEAIIANELGMRYASIVVATNWGASLQDRVSHDEVVALMAKSAARVEVLIERTIDAL